MAEPAATAATTTVHAPSRPLRRCLVCGSQDLESFLDLGRTALANRFLRAASVHDPEPTYPLRVAFCHVCAHVQLTEAVQPDGMFRDYLYTSSGSDTLVAHLEGLSRLLVSRYALGPNDLVIDIGCNDGTLLNGFRRLGVRPLGIDPAENLATFTQSSGIARYADYFTSKTAARIVEEWGNASVIVATNTFPHIQDVHDFVEGIRIALTPGGVFVIEAHYLADLLDQTAFDTIYHEHVSYWALGPMARLFGQHGMEIVDAQRLTVHHGQLRTFVQRRGEGTALSSVARILEEEQARGMDRIETYRDFASRALRIRDDVRSTVHRLRAAGERVAAYGASAKGNTLLSFAELGPEAIEYVVDRSPLKQGLLTPGTHIPVVAPERLRENSPGYLLLLAWNFVDEILQQQEEFRRRQGRFIIPVPALTIV